MKVDEIVWTILFNANQNNLHLICIPLQLQCVNKQDNVYQWFQVKEICNGLVLIAGCFVGEHALDNYHQCYPVLWR